MVFSFVIAVLLLLVCIYVSSITFEQFESVIAMCDIHVLFEITLIQANKPVI